MREQVFAKEPVEVPIQEIKAETLPVLSLPHPGYLSTKFSKFHPGIDIATGLGMPIHPITEGIVEYVEFGFLGLGNNVTISHPGGLKSTYGHMGRVFVRKDQAVNQTTTLGTVGMSGFTSGPHTHLEIEKDGKRVDPQTLLPKLEDYPQEEYLRPVEGLTDGQKLSNSLKPEL